MNQWYRVSGLVPIAILAMVFALPLKTVPVQATETYWDVEMRSEPYTVTEIYTEVEPYVTTETFTKTVNYPYSYPSIWSPIFDSTASTNCYNYPYPYCVTCSSNQTSSCRIWPPYNNWYGQGQVVTDTREVVKYRNVSKHRDVTKYRELPAKVMKERTVTRYARMSIWEYLFM